MDLEKVITKDLMEPKLAHFNFGSDPEIYKQFRVFIELRGRLCAQT